ncbi:MAG TPA: hypothetical protein PLP33_16655 [Leptospiraceae bacterium]|jgi:hypothetical protein|nr:hypothetical protein [Leptospiraceae bacterium]
MSEKRNIWTVQLKKQINPISLGDRFYSFDSERQAYEQVALFYVSSAEWFLENLPKADMIPCDSGSLFDYYDFIFKDKNYFKVKLIGNLEFAGTEEVYLNTLYYKLSKTSFNEFNNRRPSQQKKSLSSSKEKKMFLDFCLKIFEDFRDDSLKLLKKSEITYLDTHDIRFYKNHGRYFRTWVHKPTVFCSETELNESIPIFEEFISNE